MRQLIRGDQRSDFQWWVLFVSVGLCARAVPVMAQTSQAFALEAGTRTARLEWTFAVRPEPSLLYQCDELQYNCSLVPNPLVPETISFVLNDRTGNVLVTRTVTVAPFTYPMDPRTGEQIGPTPPPRAESGAVEFSVAAVTAQGRAVVNLTTSSTGTLTLLNYQVDVHAVDATPPVFHFDFSSNDPAQKVLTHKYEDADAFPLGERQLSVGPTEKPQVRIAGSVTRGGQNVEQDVYFRLIDPPDTAPYIPYSDRRNGDNKDTAAGRGRLYVLDGPGHFVIDPATGQRLTNDASGVLTTRSRPGGGVNLILETTDHVAGDNYQIEASFDRGRDFDSLAPDQPCMTCIKSAIYEAWKRIYLEVDQMFRAGAFITQDTDPAVAEVEVSDPTPFGEGQSLRFIHGSPYAHGVAAAGQTFGDTSFSEDATIALASPSDPRPGVYRLPGSAPPTWRIRLTRPLAHLFRASEVHGVDRLADAIGVIGAGFYSPNLTVVNDYFASMHVDVAEGKSGCARIPVLRFRYDHA